MLIDVLYIKKLAKIIIGIIFIASLAIAGCQSTQTTNIAGKDNKLTKTTNNTKNTKPNIKKLPTAQQTANAVGIASIGAALVAVAGGNKKAAVSILNVGSNSLKALQPLSSSGSGTAGVNLASVKIGQRLSSVSLAGQCGLPVAAVAEGKRRAWHSESSKGATPGPFQNNSSARSEILSIPKPAGFSSICEAASAQVYAFLPSLNQAITSSNRLHNGNGVGLQCSVGGASGSAACTAVNITYGLMTTSYMCHQACKAGK